MELLKEEKDTDDINNKGEEEWSDADDQATKAEDEHHPLNQTTDSVERDLDEMFDPKDDSIGDQQDAQDDEDNTGNTDLYDLIEFNGVNVPPQIRELFYHITKYRPQILEMETKLKPFLPDFIPAVGDPDAFLKVDRPDGNPELLGLTVIDEPSLNQSDPSVLDLRLRSIYKRSSSKTLVARTVEDGNKAKAIEKWIKDINELHRSKPLPSVVYHLPLPDIDTLLQEWNSEVEDVLGEEGILTPDLDCDLSSYIDIACGMLDIPVYPGNRIHSIHLLLTLYSEMGRLQK